MLRREMNRSTPDEPNETVGDLHRGTQRPFEFISRRALALILPEEIQRFSNGSGTHQLMNRQNQQAAKAVITRQGLWGEEQLNLRNH
jgi:hypothetical protein